MELLTKYKTILFLIPVFLHSYQTASGQSINQRLKVRHGCKIKDSYAMDNDIAGSLIQCVAQCTIKTGCVSISWSSNTTACMLSTTDTTFETPSHYRGYEQDDGWTCATFIKYPVFLAMKSTYGGRYEMTYPQASYRCAELGTTLADPSDIKTAQSAGLSFCNCGWISDWTNALILEYFDGSCWGYHNEGPITCGFEYADAWCKMP